MSLLFLHFCFGDLAFATTKTTLMENYRTKIQYRWDKYGGRYLPVFVFVSSNLLACSIFCRLYIYPLITPAFFLDFG